MKIIGISGKAGSGKDTVATALANAYLGTTHVLSYAAPLKARARELGWNGEKDCNGRVLLQYIGVRERQDDPNYWVKKAFEVVVRLDGPKVLFVIPDVRFKNEAEAIHERGGQVWRVERLGYDNGLSKEAKAHSSEVDLDGYDGFDETILNSGTVGQLSERVAELAKNL